MANGGGPHPTPRPKKQAAAPKGQAKPKDAKPQDKTKR
jgi:hypothetical protein